MPRRDAARTAAAERCLHTDGSSLPFQIESTRSAKLQILSHHMVDVHHIQTAGNTMKHAISGGIWNKEYICCHKVWFSLALPAETI